MKINHVTRYEIYIKDATYYRQIVDIRQDGKRIDFITRCSAGRYVTSGKFIDLLQVSKVYVDGRKVKSAKLDNNSLLIEV